MYEVLDHVAGNTAALILAGNIDAFAVAALAVAVLLPAVARAVAYLTIQHIEAGMVARIGTLLTGFDTLGW